MGEETALPAPGQGPVPSHWWVSHPSAGAGQTPRAQSHRSPTESGHPGGLPGEAKGSVSEKKAEPLPPLTAFLVPPGRGEADGDTTTTSGLSAVLQSPFFKKKKKKKTHKKTPHSQEK